jgi:hypothetical protein
MPTRRPDEVAPSIAAMQEVTMSYNSNTLWRLYQIGGADLALQYVDIAERSSRVSQRTPESAAGREPASAKQFKILDVRFYSEHALTAGSSERTFASRFPARAAWRICFETRIENPWRYTSMPLDLLARCYGPDGKRLADIQERFEAAPDHRTYRYTNGWLPQSLGQWDEGLYRVEVSVNGGQPSTDTFLVFDDAPSMRFANSWLLPRRRS